MSRRMKSCLYYLILNLRGYVDGFLQSLRLRGSNISFNTSRLAYAFHQDKASLVRVPVANVTLSFLGNTLQKTTDQFVSKPADEDHRLLPCH
ncbi:hypothetical protein Tco_0732921 [Tanacetum coccineum]